VSLNGGDELAGLAKAINGMLAAVERSQQKLRESEERYRAFVAQSSDGVWRLELEQPIPIGTPEEEQIELLYRHGYVAECNDTLAQIHGYSRADELIGTRLADLLPRSDPRSLGHARAFIRGGYRIGDAVTEETDREGKQRWFLNHLVGIVEEGALARAWGVQQDITGRRRAEALLRMQTSAINATSDQIIITDPQGNIEFVNPAFERESGLRFAEVVGRSAHILDAAVAGAGFYDRLWRAAQAGHTWQGELVSRRQDGSTYTADTTITPVRNEAGIIEHLLAIRRDVTAKKRYSEQLDHLAHHDILTALPNRLLLADRLTQSIAEAHRRQESLAILFLDLDHFKLVNDTLGHSTGDALLKLVANRLTKSLREVDTIARTGGDEFTVTASGVGSPEDAARVAQRVLDALAEPFWLENRELFVSASIGVSLFPQDGSDAETLVKNADAAMYLAKEQGRNNYQFFTRDLQAAALERMMLESNLRRALDRDEFLLHYQPRMDISLQHLLGVEALLRWRQPELGLVFPARFITLAEETGLIVPIGEWVLRTACAQSKAWRSQGLPDMTVDVNISGRQLFRQDLVGTIRRVLDDTGTSPQHLALELTERALMHSPDVAARALRELKDMGVHLFIDDFGTDHSSLSHLRRFPIEAVKIDRSFVRNVTTNPDDAAITSAIVAMAHSLKLKVIAEGVETPEQLEFLRGLDCDEIQGFFVRRPVPADEFTAHLHSRLAELVAG
jgi:diguanylate cyclase (GGDEF)-like protein/PAS domain S-box-containing protein